MVVDNTLTTHDLQNTPVNPVITYSRNVIDFTLSPIYD